VALNSTSSISLPSIQGSQRKVASAPSILMPSIEGDVLQIPYCRFARDSGGSKLESKVRWQYFFDQKKMFDTTLPGWHSFGDQDAKALEKFYINGDTNGKVRSANGYEYDMDFARMVQINGSTKTVRPIRRVDVAFRKVEVPAGTRFQVSMDLAEGEVVDWIYEILSELRLDFRVDFFPTAQPALPAGVSPTSRTNAEYDSVLKATRNANAWSFVAPAPGIVLLEWKNTFPFSSSRVLLFDWRKEAPVVEPGSKFGGPPAVPLTPVQQGLSSAVSQLLCGTSPRSSGGAKPPSPAVCMRAGCGKPTWNGEAHEYCGEHLPDAGAVQPWPTATNSAVSEHAPDDMVFEPQPRPVAGDAASIELRPEQLRIAQLVEQGEEF